MTRIESARPGPAWLWSIESPVRLSEPSTSTLLPVSEAVAAAGQRVLGGAGDAGLRLGADHEEHEREQQPAAHGDRGPLRHAPAGDRLAVAGLARPLVAVRPVALAQGLEPRGVGLLAQPPRAGLVDLVFGLVAATGVVHEGGW